MSTRGEFFNNFVCPDAEREKQMTLESMEPLFKQAVLEKKWFWSGYREHVSTPREIKTDQQNGDFIWGITSWKLVDPPSRKSLIVEILIAIVKTLEYNRDLKRRLKNAWDI